MNISNEIDRLQKFTDWVSRQGKGTILLAFSMWLFVHYMSEKQREEFIDNFVLMHFLQFKTSYLHFMAVMNLVVYLLTIQHFRNKMGLLEIDNAGKGERMDLLEEQNDHLQKLLIKTIGK